MVTVVRHKWEPVTTEVGVEPACAAGASAWRMPDRPNPQSKRSEWNPTVQTTEQKVEVEPDPPNTHTAGGRGSTRARKKCTPT